MRPPVARFIPSSLIEWEGRIAAVVVLQGCGYRCPFCHSAEMVPMGEPPEPVPWDAVRSRLERSDGWVDGVVVSGGEPTVHDGLAELLGELAEAGMPVKLDTNGSGPARLRELIAAGLVEQVALDVKAPLEPEPYARATGGAQAAIERTRESLEVLREGGVGFELRTTLAPTVLDRDNEEALLGLARELSWAPLWYLQAFRPEGCLDPEFERFPATDPAWIEEIVERCRQFAPGCRAR